MAQIHVVGLNAGRFDNLGGGNDTGGLIVQPSGAVSPGLEIQIVSAADGLVVSKTPPGPAVLGHGISLSLNSFCSGDGVHVAHAGGGAGVYLAPSGGGLGLQIANTGTASSFYTSLSNNNQGVVVSHSGGGYGIQIAHSGAGSGIYVSKSVNAAGYGLDVQMSSANTSRGINVAHQGTGDGIYVSKSNTGAGRGVAAVMGSLTTDLGFYVWQQGTGSGMQIDSTNANANAGVMVNYAGVSNGLFVSHTGGGAAAHGIRLEMSPAVSTAAYGVVVIMTSTCSGRGYHLTHPGTGIGAYFDLTNAANASDGINLDHAGTGIGIDVNLTNTSNANAGVDVAQAGSGNGITISKTTTAAGYGLNVSMAAVNTLAGINVTHAGSGVGASILKSGATGGALSINTTSAGNGNATFEAQNAGSGRSINVFQTNASNASYGLYLSNAGTGAAIYVTQTNAGNSSDGITIAHSGTGYGLNSNRSIWVNGVIYPDINTAMKEPTGFPTAGAGGTLSFTDGSRTFTHTPTGSFSFYINGVLFTKSVAQSIVISTTDGYHFIWYDASGNLAEGLVPPTGLNLPLVAAVYWNNTFGKGLLYDERHGIQMDAATHYYLHTTVGARYLSGFTITPANSTFSITQGSMADEDIVFDTGGTKTTCDVFYLNGSSTYWWQASSAALWGTPFANLRFNTGTTLNVTQNGYFTAYWVFATDAVMTRNEAIAVIIGQREDNTLAQARLNNTYDGLATAGVPLKEMKLLYRVIYQNVGGTPTYVEFADYRAVSNLPSGTYTATSHSLLTNLGNDDHLQYLLLAGRTTDSFATFKGYVSAPAWLNTAFGTTLMLDGIKSFDSTSGGFPTLTSLVGASTASGKAGGVMLLGGDSSANEGGPVLLIGGASTNSASQSGGVFIASGVPGATGKSGKLNFATFPGGATSGDSGDVEISTGTTTSGFTGSIVNYTGNATLGNTGNISFTTGNTADLAGTSGNINLVIGTGAGGNAGSINLGRTGSVCSINVGQATGALNIYNYWATYQTYESITYNLPPSMGGAMVVPSAGITTKDAHTGGSPGSYVSATVRGASTTTLAEKGGIAGMVGGAGGVEGDGGPCVILGGTGGAADLITDAGEGGPIIISGGVGGAATGSYPAGKGGWIGLIGNIGGAGSATQNAGRGSDIQIFGGPAGAANGGNGERGGDITLTGGQGTGTGRGGNVNIDGGAAPFGNPIGIVYINANSGGAINIGRDAFATTVTGELAVTTAGTLFPGVVVTLSHASNANTALSVSHAGTGNSFTVNQSNALNSTAAASIYKIGTGDALFVSKNTTGGGYGIEVSMGASTTQTGLVVQQTGTGAGAAVAITNASNSSNTLSVATSGTGRGIIVSLTNGGNANSGIDVQHAGSGDGISVTQSGTGYGIDVSAGAGRGINVTTTTGTSLYIVQSGASGGAMYVSQTADSISPCAQFTRGGTQAECVTASHTGGQPAISAIPSGTSRGLYVNSSSTGIGSQGIYVNKTAGAAGIQVQMGASTTGIGVLADQDGTGLCAQFTKNNATGMVVSMSQDNASNTLPTLLIGNAGSGPGISVTANSSGPGVLTTMTGTTHGLSVNMDGMPNNRGAAGLYVQYYPAAARTNNYGVYVTLGVNNDQFSYGGLLLVGGTATNLWASKAGTGGGGLYTGFFQQDAGCTASTALVAQSEAGGVFNFGTSSANALYMNADGVIRVGSTGNPFRNRSKYFSPDVWSVGMRSTSPYCQWELLFQSSGITDQRDGFTWRNTTDPAVLQIPLAALPHNATLTQFDLNGFHNTTSVTTRFAIVRRPDNAMWDNTNAQWVAFPNPGYTVFVRPGASGAGGFTLSAVINGTSLVLDQTNFSYAIVVSCSGAVGGSGSSLYWGRAYYRWSEINM